MYDGGMKAIFKKTIDDDPDIKLL